MACMGVGGVGVLFRPVASGKSTTCQWIAPHPEYVSSTNCTLWIIKGEGHKIGRGLIVDLGWVWGGMRSGQNT